MSRLPLPMTLQKTESFVPLTAAASHNENREFRLTVIPQTEPSRTFQSLEQIASSAAEAGLLHGKKHGEPLLSVQREGGRITNIRIQCGCGQVMELACVYDEPVKKA